MRADWTACGACISGSTAPLRDATRRACGGVTTTHMTTVDRRAEYAFVGLAVLLFVGSATLTTLWCASMRSMGGMPMPGGWTMSMAWMRLPDQSWSGAASSFVGMWVVMMVAMMLPSVAP